jgi:hypothetical protein
LHPEVFGEVLIPAPQGESSLWTFILHVRFLSFLFLCFKIYIELGGLLECLCACKYAYLGQSCMLVFMQMPIYTHLQCLCVSSTFLPDKIRPWSYLRSLEGPRSYLPSNEGLLLIVLI